MGFVLDIQMRCIWVIFNDLTIDAPKLMLHNPMGICLDDTNPNITSILVTESETQKIIKITFKFNSTMIDDKHVVSIANIHVEEVFSLKFLQYSPIKISSHCQTKQIILSAKPYSSGNNLSNVNSNTISGI